MVIQALWNILLQAQTLVRITQKTRNQFVTKTQRLPSRQQHNRWLTVDIVNVAADNKNSNDAVGLAR